MQSPFDYEIYELPPALEPPLPSLTKAFAWIKVGDCSTTKIDVPKSGSVTGRQRSQQRQRCASYCEGSKVKFLQPEPIRRRPRSTELGAVRVWHQGTPFCCMAGSLPTVNDIIMGRSKEPFSLRNFREFLVKTFADELLDFYLAVRAFRNLHKLASSGTKTGSNHRSSDSAQKVDLFYFGMLRQHITSTLTLFLTPGMASREVDLPDTVRTPLVQTVTGALAMHRQSVLREEDAVETALTLLNSIEPTIFDNAANVVFTLLSLDKYKVFVKHVEAQHASNGALRDRSRSGLSKSSSRSGLSGSLVPSRSKSSVKTNSSNGAAASNSWPNLMRLAIWKEKRNAKMKASQQSRFDHESATSVGSRIYISKPCFPLFSRGIF